MVGRLGGHSLGVLELLAQGFTNKEIAIRLGLAEPTIKWHVSKLLASYGAANRAQLVCDAIARGDLDVRTVAAVASSDLGQRR